MQFVEHHVEVLITKLMHWSETIVSMLPNIILAFIIFYAFYKVGQLVQNGMARVLQRTSNNEAVNRILLNLVYTIVICIGLFSALEVLNLEKAVTSLLAGAGIIGLTIGFAFQEIASNFFAGILIAFKKPYKVGDTVSLDTYHGVVNDITLRTTNLTTPQGLEVLIPNKDMFTKALINYTLTPDRRVDITVGISYAEDLRKVEALTKAALEKVAFRNPNRPIEFNYKEFNSSSIDFVVSYWIDYTGGLNYRESIHDAIILIKECYDKNKITIPYPIRTLDFGIKGG